MAPLVLGLLKYGTAALAGAMVGSALTEPSTTGNPLMMAQMAQLYGMPNLTYAPYASGFALQRAYQTGYFDGTTDQALRDAQAGVLGGTTPGEAAYLLQANQLRFMRELAMLSQYGAC